MSLSLSNIFLLIFMSGFFVFVAWFGHKMEMEKQSKYQYECQQRGTI